MGSVQFSDAQAALLVGNHMEQDSQAFEVDNACLELVDEQEEEYKLHKLGAADMVGWKPVASETLVENIAEKAEKERKLG